MIDTHEFVTLKMCRSILESLVLGFDVYISYQNLLFFLWHVWLFWF